MCWDECSDQVLVAYCSELLSKIIRIDPDLDFLGITRCLDDHVVPFECFQILVRV